MMTNPERQGPRVAEEPGIEPRLQEFARFLEEARQWAKSHPNAESPLIWGYGVSAGPAGQARVERFGNLRDPKSFAEGTREPVTAVRVDDEKGFVLLSAELPGIERKDIHTTLTEDELTIEAQGRDRKYHRAVHLPRSVDPNTGRAKLYNGMLLISFEVLKPEEPKGHELRIE